MDRNLEGSVASLVDVYAKYFIEDYALNVLGLIKASVPADLSLITPFVQDEVSKLYPSSVVDGTSSTVTQFLYECANFALERSVSDPQSRQTYDTIKELPSAYHDEIAKLTFVCAERYLKTLDFTVLATVGSDAAQVASQIATAVRERVSNQETGARVHKFTWGVLNDGLWLNGALLKAFDTARIFRPGEPALSYYAVTALDKARGYSYPVTDRAARDQAIASLEVVLNHTEGQLGLLDVEELRTALFGIGGLENAIDGWELGLKNTRDLVGVVTNLSGIAGALPYLCDAAAKLSSEDLVCQHIGERLRVLSEVVTMVLVGYQALRETTYKEALVLDVRALTADPVVDVYINADLLNGFVSAGGTEEDFAHIGSTLDPRGEMLKPSVGWSINWVLQRRSDLISSAMAVKAERIEQLRNNDRSVIGKVVEDILGPVVATYLEASQQTAIADQVAKQVYNLAKQLSSETPSENFLLETEIARILVAAINDPMVTMVASAFCLFATSNDDVVRQNSRAFTIAHVAVSDAGAFFKAPATSIDNIRDDQND